MKTAGLFTLLTLGLFAWLGSLEAAPPANGRNVSIQGILVMASDSGNHADPRLRAYEPTLRRLFRFQSYRVVGESRASLSIPGSGNLNLPNGSRVRLQADSGNGARVRARVEWIRGNTTLINTVVVMHRGTPTLLGGPAVQEGNGNLILILLAR